MKLKTIFSTVSTLLAVGSAISAFGQTTVYEQSRLASGTNADFTFFGFTATVSANKSTAPGIPAVGSPGSRIASTGNPPAGAGTNFILSPNNTTAGQLVNGTTYAVAVTFGSTGANESSDLVVTTSDTQTTGNDTFAGTTSAFKSGYGYNSWITIGNITVNGALPTFRFQYLSGTNNRWYVDTIRFTPLTPVTASYQYWDTGSPGGSGIWDTTTSNWNTLANGLGTQGIYVQTNLAAFGGTAGTVSITGGGITTDGGLEFDTTGYVITNGPLTLGQGTNITVLGSATTATIYSVITGTNGLCTTGSGTLVLATTNNLTGTVTLTSGTISLATNQTFTSIAGNISGTLALNTNTLTVGDTNNTTCASTITDAGLSTPGYLVKQGSGILSLNGVSSFHGSTTIGAGALTVGSDAAFGTVPASLVTNQIIITNGGRLDFPAVIALSATRGITLGNGGGTVSTPGSGTTVTLSEPISGSGSLIVPSGGFDLKASNSFTGGIYVTATQVDTGGNNLCSVRFDAAGSSGTGKIFMQPITSVNCTLRDFNTPSVIVPNAMEFDLWTNTQASAQIYLAGGASGTNVYAITFSGNINGAAPVNIGLTSAGGSSNPGGVVNLSGSNSLWTGGATLQAGTLGLGSSNALGTGELSLLPAGPAGVLLATTPLTGASALTMPVAINTSGSPLTIGGTNSFELAGPIFLYGSSTLTVTNTAATIFSGPLADSAPSSGFSLSLNGTGTLTLSGSNSYDGGTSVSSGTLTVNNTTGSGTGTGSVFVSPGATLGGGGTISGTVDLFGTISPGNSPGKLTTADETWEGGASYNWEINKAGGTAGADPGWDQANITGALTINASSGSPFTINLASLTLADAPGLVADFNSGANYTWSIAHASGGIVNFNTNAFVLNTAGFSNGLGSGSFSITNSATDVLLQFITPVSSSTISSIHVSGTNLTLSGTGGTPNGTFRVLTSTNVTNHLATWTQVGTGTNDPSGNFIFNGSITSGDKQQFYIIVSP